MIGWGSRLPIRVKLSTGGVFSGVLLGKRTADPEPSSTTYYTSIDAVPAKGVPLEVSSIHLIPWGSYSPKNPHFEDSNGDFQHKRLPAYLGKEETFHDALDGSKCASRQDTQCAIRKIRGWCHFRGQIYKSFKGKFATTIKIIR